MIFLGDFFAFFLFFFRDSLCRNMKELKFLVLREFWYFTSNDDMQFSCWLVFSSACFLLRCFFFLVVLFALSLSLFFSAPFIISPSLCFCISLLSSRRGLYGPIYFSIFFYSSIQFQPRFSSFSVSLSLSPSHTGAGADTHARTHT